MGNNISFTANDIRVYRIRPNRDYKDWVDELCARFAWVDDEVYASAIYGAETLLEVYMKAFSSDDFNYCLDTNGDMYVPVKWVEQINPGVDLAMKIIRTEAALVRDPSAKPPPFIERIPFAPCTARIIIAS